MSPLDTTIGRLYDALRRYHDGHDIGSNAISGEDLERWTLKVWAGMLASGNMKMKTGERIAKAVPPLDVLSVLFSETAMPDGAGLHFFEKGSQPLPFVSLGFYPMTRAADHERAGEIYGATFLMLGCPFTTVTTRLTSTFGRLWYRPAALLVGAGRIDLDWTNPTPTEPIELKVPPVSQLGES